jgi:DNA-binding transcriptional ArsR family regulator
MRNRRRTFALLLTMFALAAVPAAHAGASGGPGGARRVPRKSWTFITHHAQVLLTVARDPSARVNEIAEASGITERYAYRLLSDLQKAGYVSRRRNGRRNRYELAPDLKLGDPVIGERPLRQLLALIGADRS